MITRTLSTSLVAAFTLTAAVGGCSGRDETSVQRQTPLQPEPGEASRTGSVALAISSGGLSLSSVRYRVEDASGNILLAGVLELDSPSAALTLQFDAPAGAGYRIALSAEGGAGVTCSGASSFDVVAGAATDVLVRLECEASSVVTVVGNVIPPSRCPEVQLNAPSAPIYVGDAVQLEAAALGDGAQYAWASSGGTLTDSGSRSASFSCTAPGPVTLSLTVTQGECTDVASVQIECSPSTTSACSGLGSACHVVDLGSGPEHECHELGHGGTEAECTAQRASCIDTCGAALCQTLGSLCHEVDPGHGPLHECHELGHAGIATACFERGRECFDLCTAERDARRQAVTLSFAAKVGGADFACGTTYEDVGSTAVEVEPRDFRFFVSDVRLITASGAEEPVVLDTRAPWQLPQAALLDFADAEGVCPAASAATNTTVTGRVFPGEYVGVAFRVGVPEEINHADPATLAPPLDLGPMSWSWLQGYKFLVAELQAADAGDGGVGVLHLGSTACSGNPRAGTVVCSNPNRSDIVLTGFDAAANTIVADIGALFAGIDLAQDTLCHPSGPACPALFTSAGIDYATGQPLETQTLFRVE